ncbi:hypothetical protein BH11MYX2_BH11MYX2_10150 [soil metagenome]
MTTTIKNASWDVVQGLRADMEVGLRAATSLQDGAQKFVEMFRRSFDTVALARMFLVLPFAELPQVEQLAARELVVKLGRAPAIDAATPVLTLLATSGERPAWNRREQSAGHRAIPLVDTSLVDGAPMIAALLSALRVDLEHLRADASTHLRSLAGGLNSRFYVPDARSTVDARGRRVIAATDFVEQYTIRTVFGMGGAYLGGGLVVAIVFTKELLPELHVDRFPSFIGTFKIATTSLVDAKKFFAATEP